MSWHFSLALVADCLVRDCSDLIQSSQLSKIPFAPDDSCSDKMKGTFHHSPFGMMFVPSTDDHGAKLLMSFQAASPARIFPVLERVLGLTESDPACSSKWCGSLAKFDPASFGWKTAQISLITGLSESLGSLPRWGTMLDGELLARQQPALTMYERGAGYLPTPMASDNRDRGNTDTPVVQRRMRIGKQVNLSMLFKGGPCPSCVEGMMGWPMGWSSSAPLATDKFQQWLEQHGSY